MTAKDESRQCKAITKKGTRCLTGIAKDGLCHVHHPEMLWAQQHPRRTKSITGKENTMSKWNPDYAAGLDAAETAVKAIPAPSYCDEDWGNAIDEALVAIRALKEKP